LPQNQRIRPVRNIVSLSQAFLRDLSYCTVDYFYAFPFVCCDLEVFPAFDLGSIALKLFCLDNQAF